MSDLIGVTPGSAIHGAERILNILGQRVKYPGLSHINNYKDYEKVEFSVAALKAYKRGKKTLIEHGSPLRDFTRQAVEIINGMPKNRAAMKAKLKAFVRKNYRLVLLTPSETEKFNKIYRTQMRQARLEQAEISTVYLD